MVASGLFWRHFCLDLSTVIDGSPLTSPKLSKVQPGRRLACGQTCHSQDRGITEDVAGFSRLQVGELRMLVQDALPHEPAFFEHPPGRPMLGVTNCVQPPDANRSSGLNHRVKRFGRVSLSPRILGEDITRRGSVRRFERQPGATQKRPVSACPNEVRTRWPAIPFGLAERDERVRIGQGPMSWPPDEARNIRIARIPRTDSFLVGRKRSS